MVQDKEVKEIILRNVARLSTNIICTNYGDKGS
jgi:hypothetical protein